MSIGKYILPTYTGKLFDLENPIEDMICIEDIAHHLSLENRYNGSTRFPLSVAQHSLMVCQMAPKELKLEALLHDREEAYYKDWPAPLKRMVNESVDRHKSVTFYPKMIARFELASIIKFKLSRNPTINNTIKEIDLRMASTEILQLLSDFHIKFWQHDYDKYPAYTDLIIREMLPSTIEQMFKEEYQKWRRD